MVSKPGVPPALTYNQAFRLSLIRVKLSIVLELKTPIVLANDPLAWPQTVLY